MNWVWYCFSCWSCMCCEFILLFSRGCRIQPLNLNTAINCMHYFISFHRWSGSDTFWTGTWREKAGEGGAPYYVQVKNLVLFSSQIYSQFVCVVYKSLDVFWAVIWGHLEGEQMQKKKKTKLIPHHHHYLVLVQLMVLFYPPLCLPYLKARCCGASIITTASTSCHST